MTELEREQKAHEETLAERDRLQDLLDEFVERLGGTQIHGEHSNLNCPWDSALTEAQNLFEAGRFLARAADGEHRIVCLCDLNQFQIAEAQANGKWFVLNNGLGFALLPWRLTTDKDNARYAANMGE